MPTFEVSYRMTIEADSQEAAALEVARLLMTNRPREFAVTGPRAPTIFVRVEREKATRIA